VSDSELVKSVGETWRFIDSGQQNGALNMALDMAMTQEAASSHSLPTLRVFGWQPSAISLGYHQSENDVDIDRCREDNIDVVLRPTGGRAILHNNELTYSVAIPPESIHFAPDIQTVYALISRGLVAALKRLNISVEFDRADKTPKDFGKGELSTLCYASSVKYEINVGRKKLVGSAQRRINGGVLQHGSILIGDDHLKITRYLAAQSEQWRTRVQEYMQKKTVSLNQVSETPITSAQIAGAIEKGFNEELGITFEQDGFSKSELDLAKQIQEKFAILTN
jgi:lipoyl(octanoyl) transferase